MTIEQRLDDLAAGDEVRLVLGELEQMQTQLESLGASRAPKPIGHILVPRHGAGLSLPKGKATIDFRAGTVTHEELGTVVDDLVTVDDLVEGNARQPQLENLIFHSDTLVSVDIGEQDQEIFLQNVPIPEADFDSIEVNMRLPGELTVLASTQQLPIGLGAITVHGSRHGEHADAVTDALEAVPVSTFGLWNEYGTQYAEDAVYTAPYDSVTWVVENTGAANELEAVVEATAGPQLASATWREIARDTIPNGDHSTFNVTQRHRYLRVRVTNTTTGQSIGASVDLMEANP